LGKHVIAGLRKKRIRQQPGGVEERKEDFKMWNKDIGSILVFVFLCKLKGYDSDLELVFLKSLTLFS
jgi:hypothetical protein